MVSGIDFVNRIDSLLKGQGITRKNLAEKLNINSSTMSAWKTNNALPPVETVVLIAKELSVSIDFLVTGKFFKLDEKDPYTRGFKDGVNFCKDQINKLAQGCAN